MIRDHLHFLLEDSLINIELNPPIGCNKLLMMREFIFPPESDPTIQPEQLNPLFVDFLGDTGMWDWISKNKSNPNIHAITIIRDSVRDLLERKSIFNDKYSI